MTRKRPNILVADWNDDGTSRIVNTDELRAQRKAREAKLPHIPASVKGPRDMLWYLAVHKLDPDFGIPAAVIDAIAIALAGKDAWSKVLAKLDASNEGRRAERDRRRRKARSYGKAAGGRTRHWRQHHRPRAGRRRRDHRRAHLPRLH